MKKRLIILPALVAAIGFPSMLLVADVFNTKSLNTERETQWSIGIYEGKSPLEMRDAKGVKNPVIQASDVTDVKAQFVADPFLIKKGSTWYLFFEVLNELTAQGDIGFASSEDAHSWKYNRIVLDEPFHLSYPFVFEYRDAMYMIPESAEAKELRLYKAVVFPYQWKFVKTLLKGDFGDHSLVQIDSTWWLFAGADPHGHSSLRLFYSDSLFGDWKEHPMSPIVKNNAKKARPGGRIIQYNKSIYRLAQDCAPTYGAALNAFEIVVLTKTDYQEKPSNSNPVLKAHGNDWARHGMHQLDAQKLDSDTWIGCVDGYKKRFIVKLDY